MSRIGKQAIEVPSNVKVSLRDGAISIESGGKTLELALRPEVTVAWNENEKEIVVAVDEAHANKRFANAMWGTTRALIQNMIVGVTKGYQKQLEVVGVGWGAVVNGNRLEIKAGFANPIVAEIPQGLDVSVDRSVITIKGVDKQAVGEFAAKVRARRKPEPYNGKGIKYIDEVIRRKSGKAFSN